MASVVDRGVGCSARAWPSVHARSRRRAPAKPLAGLRLDYAYYNPVGLVLKDKGWVEEEFGKDRHQGRMGAEPRQQQGARIPQRLGRRFRLDRRRRRRCWRAGQRQPDQGGLHLLAAGMDGARHRSRTCRSARSTDLKGKRVAVTRGTDPHIFLLRALDRLRHDDADIKMVLLQHPDGKTALDAGRCRCLGRARPLHGADRARRRARACSSATPASTPTAFSMCGRTLPRSIPTTSCACCASTSAARQWALANPDGLRDVLAKAAKLTDPVAAKELERTDLEQPGDRRRASRRRSSPPATC